MASSWILEAMFQILCDYQANCLVRGLGTAALCTGSVAGCLKSVIFQWSCRSGRHSVTNMFVIPVAKDPTLKRHSYATIYIRKQPLWLIGWFTALKSISSNIDVVLKICEPSAAKLCCLLLCRRAVPAVHVLVGNGSQLQPVVAPASLAQCTYCTSCTATAAAEWQAHGGSCARQGSYPNCRLHEVNSTAVSCTLLLSYFRLLIIMFTCSLQKRKLQYSDWTEQQHWQANRDMLHGFCGRMFGFREGKGERKPITVIFQADSKPITDALHTTSRTDLTLSSNSKLRVLRQQLHMLHLS